MQTVMAIRGRFVYDFSDGSSQRTADLGAGFPSREPTVGSSSTRGMLEI